jgi:hypothetical protein
MLLNIACFVAVYLPNDILLSSFGAAVADRISDFLFPVPSSDTKRISVVGERFSLYTLNTRSSRNVFCLITKPNVALGGVQTEFTGPASIPKKILL